MSRSRREGGLAANRAEKDGPKIGMYVRGTNTRLSLIGTSLTRFGSAPQYNGVDRGRGTGRMRIDDHRSGPAMKRGIGQIYVRQIDNQQHQ